MQKPVRTLSFPQNFSLGRLYARDEYVDELLIGEATGDLCVDADARLTLKIRTDVKLDLSSLTSFEPDSLFALSLANTQITDEQLKYVAHLSKLKSLYLQHTNLKGWGFVHLRGLTSLRNLSLWWTKVTDEYFIYLSELVSLEALNLSSTRITDHALSHLQNLAKLENLDLWGTNTGDKCLNYLKAMPSLTVLGLANTRITDAGLAHLSQLPLR